MNIKKCQIYDKSTKFQFYGILDLDRVGNEDYDLVEVPQNLIGKEIKWDAETNKIVKYKNRNFKKDIKYYEK